MDGWGSELPPIGGDGAGNFAVTAPPLAASVPASATNKTNKTERLDMVRALLLAVGLSSALALAANAQDEKKPDAPKRPPLTEEQKALRKEITEKYDKDKDGKLSPEERKAISEEDKARMEKAGIGGQRRKPAPPK